MLLGKFPQTDRDLDNTNKIERKYLCNVINKVELYQLNGFINEKTFDFYFCAAAVILFCAG